MLNINNSDNNFLYNWLLKIVTLCNNDTQSKKIATNTKTYLENQTMDSAIKILSSILVDFFFLISDENEERILQIIVQFKNILVPKLRVLKNKSYTIQVVNNIIKFLNQKENELLMMINSSRRRVTTTTNSTPNNHKIKFENGIISSLVCMLCGLILRLELIIKLDHNLFWHDFVLWKNELCSIKEVIWGYKVKVDLHKKKMLN
ncbi:hypothetical protein CsatB_002062 [Cannabis sativa]